MVRVHLLFIYTVFTNAELCWESIPPGFETHERNDQYARNFLDDSQVAGFVQVVI
jgi:hypothetical protein